jgi:hypothetical protein
MPAHKNKVFQLILFLIIYAPYPITAQKKSLIEVDKIEDKHVRKGMKKRNMFYFSDIKQIEPACYNLEDSSYYEHIKEYNVAQKLEDTWNVYTSLDFKKTWNGKRMVHYGFVYDSNKDTILYPTELNQKIEVGRKVFFNVRILGFLNLITGLEVTEINEEEHSLTFCYLEGGNTMGTQKIILEPVNDTTTVVKHITNYRSMNLSKLRDKRLYPFFHTKSINEIHGNAIGK